MIALLTGTVASVTLLGEIIIDVNGVGYKVNIPEKETTHIKKGDFLSLHISTHVREDAIILFGFTEPTTRDLFEKLTSVSGIGGKMGLAMISALTPQGIVDALSTNDVDMLCRVPGVGKKTAQRMIVELSSLTGLTDIFMPSPVNSSVKDVSEALEELGYRRDEISRVIHDLDPTLSVDVMIKECLRLLANG
ncbi:MAG TPA: Holliday junction branch migration protein RuvA [Acidimicrobiia bacterium]|nr:Holliday junction branch migration protein RuvA [Acidimicrobiia bacterium]